MEKKISLCVQNSLSLKFWHKSLFQDEQINPDPEGWVLEILTNPDVKVVVVENIEDRIFHPTSSTFPSSEKTRDETLLLLDTSSSVNSIERFEKASPFGLSISFFIFL